MWKWLLVFGAMFVTDVVWAKYTQAVAKRQPVRAGFWSVGIILAGAYVTMSYVEDAWYLIPAVLGAFLGTVTALWWSKA